MAYILFVKKFHYSSICIWLFIITYPLYPFIRHRRIQDEPFRVNLQDEPFRVDLQDEPLSCQKHWYWLRGFPGRKGE